MKAWKKHRKHYREYWLWALAMRKFMDYTLAFILAKGKRVRFERKRDVPLKRAMQLVQAARDKKDGDRDA
ncbi:hypothetical protein [uncultured Mitsuokella sp.]|uniref:hypothetical protein n=1 Tax=uncultured Mitsuokella sp. TaxID=453120 RepID=UPI00265D3737|nr:hypothetical protein [uncultured Mitsuokella sp.]